MIRGQSHYISPIPRVTLREALSDARPPFSPDAVIDDFAALLKSYRVSRVIGDRYAGEFPRELFRKHCIAYDLAKQTKGARRQPLTPKVARLAKHVGQRRKSVHHCGDFLSQVFGAKRQIIGAQ